MRAEPGECPDCGEDVLVVPYTPKGSATEIPLRLETTPCEAFMLGGATPVPVFAYRRHRYSCDAKPSDAAPLALKGGSGPTPEAEKFLREPCDACQHARGDHVNPRTEEEAKAEATLNVGTGACRVLACECSVYVSAPPRGEAGGPQPVDPPRDC